MGVNKCFYAAISNVTSALLYSTIAGVPVCPMYKLWHVTNNRTFATFACRLHRIASLALSYAISMNLN